MVSETDEDEKLQEKPDINERISLFKKEALPHYNDLFKYALSISPSRYDAEDLVQETLKKAFRYLHQYTPDTNCRAWLFTILRNIYNTNYKQYKTSPDKVHYDDEEQIHKLKVDKRNQTSYENPEEKLLSGHLPKDVIQSLKELSDKYQTCVILYDIKDYSYEKIADILDIPVGTVMSRLHRARDVLKEKLADFARNKGVIGQETYRKELTS